MNNRNFRAKIIVDLLMSIECSLKSLIISLSIDNEPPEIAFKKLKNLSHSLEKLYEEVASRSKNRFKIHRLNKKLFNDLKKLGVRSRYAYEICSIRTQSNSGPYYLGNDLISLTIDDPRWAISLRNEAVIFNNLATKCQVKYLSKHAILSGNKISTYDAALKACISKIVLL